MSSSRSQAATSGELASCQSPEAADGEVVTSTLDGELGIITNSAEGPASNKVGTDLKPASGEVVAAFACAGTPVSISGSVIGQLPRNSMKLTSALKFVASSKGIQKPARFEDEPEDALLSKFGESGVLEHTGMTLTMVQTNKEVEVNSVV